MIAVIDTETNFYNEVISIGIIISDNDFKSVCGCYYIIEPEASYPSMFAGVLYRFLDEYKAYKCNREQAINNIRNLLNDNNVECIYAYNARFDYMHMMELSDYSWIDIMMVAAYRQYNRFIPKYFECSKSGRMKRGYGVEGLLRMTTGNPYYREVHNAIYDARDELKLLELLGVDRGVYEEVAVINRK